MIVDVQPDPDRCAIETIQAEFDPLENYFAVNVLYEALVMEPFRSGFIMQRGAMHGDFVTHSITNMCGITMSDSVEGRTVAEVLTSKQRRSWRWYDDGADPGQCHYPRRLCCHQRSSQLPKLTCPYGTEA